MPAKLQGLLDGLHNSGALAGKIGFLWGVGGGGSFIKGPSKGLHKKNAGSLDRVGGNGKLYKRTIRGYEGI